MTFAHPSLLWLMAALVPAMVLFWWWAWRQRKRLIEKFVPRRLQDALTIGLSPQRARVRAILVIGGIAFLLLALARPRYGAGSVEVTQRALDILVAIDTSRSMLAEDTGPGVSRLRRAQLAALDLARLARGDRVGLIAFAGTAFLQCPLTIDDEAFRQSVEALDTEIIPEGGTSLGAAIETATEAFKDSQDNVPVLVLFTDGEEHDESAAEAAKRAEARGLKVFTVGVGTTRGEIIRLHDENGRETYLKDDQGNVVKSSLNEALLQEVARITRAVYLPLQGARPMEELFANGLAHLPRADLESRLIQQYKERFQWPLALALLLLASEVLLPERGKVRGSARTMRLAHPTLIGPATALVLALAPLATSASPGSALRLYRKGDYQAAEREYNRLAERRPDDARLRFNAGTAALRAGDHERAVELLSETLRTSNLRLLHDAYYNLGNGLFAHGETLSEPSATQSAWEQSIQSFESALKLQPDDANARHNLDYVRQRLEELKQQQQQQQQQQNQNQDQEQNQQDKENNQQQQQKDQQQDNESQQNKDPGQSPENSASQQAKKEQPQDRNSEEPDAPQPEPEDPSDPKDQPKPGQNAPDNSPENQENATPMDPGDIAPEGQMTPRQALRLLDAAKDDEKPLPLRKQATRRSALKDW
jgi:Ca-activated chloride channel family protein